MHAVAVELDFVEPVVAVRRCVDELGELRRDPSVSRSTLRIFRSDAAAQWRSATAVA
jgi:hypothetical protein